MDIHAIYYRNNPIILGCAPQRPPDEVSRYRALTRSAIVRENIVKAGVPDVTAVWAHEIGTARLLLGVAIKQRYGGHAKQAGHVAAMCHSGAYAGRYVIVCDDDIDVSNLDELIWAMLTRSDPATSIDIITNAWSTPLDPRIEPERKAKGDFTNSPRHHRRLQAVPLAQRVPQDQCAVAGHAQARPRTFRLSAQMTGAGPQNGPTTMTLTIGTAEPRSTFHIQGEKLARILKRIGEGVQVQNSPGASIGNARSLEAGEIDLGFMASNWVGLAESGKAPFAAPIALRMVAPMNAGPLFFVTLANKPIDTIAGIKGKRVAVGPQTSGMHQHARSILGVLGIGFDSFEPVYLDFAAGAKALIAGDVDVQLQSPIPNPIMDDLARSAKVRAVPPSAAEIDKVVAAVPHYRRTVLRAGAFEGHAADMDQIAVINVLVTHARAGNERIAAVVSDLIENCDALMASEPLFVGLDTLLNEVKASGVARLEADGIPVHPGAKEAYRLAGYLD